MAKNPILFIFFFLFSAFALQAEALLFQVTGKNREILLRPVVVELALPSNVGKISVAVFTQKNVTFEGGAEGFSKIAGIDQEVQTISGSEMKAYGWCFSLNGKIPETMPDQTPVVDEHTVIEWYCGYAHYKNGQWIGQCLKD